MDAVLEKALAGLLHQCRVAVNIDHPVSQLRQHSSQITGATTDMHHHMVGLNLWHQAQQVANRLFSGNGVAGDGGDKIGTGNKIGAGNNSEGLNGPLIELLHSAASDKTPDQAACRRFRAETSSASGREIPQVFIRSSISAPRSTSRAASS